MENPAIARSARRLRAAVVSVIILIVLFTVLATVAPDAGPVRVETRSYIDGWAGPVLVNFTVGLFVVALVRLAQMLGAVADGPLFGPRVTRAFRGFAFWLFVATLVDVAGEPIVALLSSATTGVKHAALVFELRDLLMLAGALFLFLLARMLEQARDFESELEEIV